MTSLPPCSCIETGMAQCARHGVVKQPRAEKKPAPKSRRRSRVNPKTEKQSQKEAFWAGVKDGIIYTLKKLDPDGPCCVDCGRKGDNQSLDLDHIRPKSLGGANRAHNAALRCRSCHSKKHGEPFQKEAS